MTQKKWTASAIEGLVTKLIPDNEFEPKSITDVVNLPTFRSKMMACETHCNLPYNKIPIEIQDALVLRRLQQVTNIIKLNAVWLQKLKEAGVKETPKSFNEWQNMPLSDKETQKTLFMGDRPGLVVPLEYGGFEIVASGGTSSGTPVETVYSLQELDDTYKIAGDFIGKHMLNNYLDNDEPKWVATTLADYQMWSSGTMVGGVLQKIPNVNYIAAGPLSSTVYQHMMSYKGSKAIMAISQGIAMLSKLGDNMCEESRKSLKVAMYGSGVLTNCQQQELKEMYPNVSILSYFAATQAETIGLQLDANSPTLSSVPGLHFIEIVDEDGKWVKEGEEGELVITRLHANEAPLLRFKLGDRMIRKPILKSKNLVTTQFEFAGRSGDVIHLNDTQYSAKLAFEEIAKNMKENFNLDLKDIAKEVQFLNYRKDCKLSLLVISEDSDKYNKALAKALGDNTLKDTFINSLINSLPIFNKTEANPASIEKTKYDFEILFVSEDSELKFTTSVGKVPLIRDIF
ncbi:phenylacetate--CoA ligase family protein [Saccharicrinis aurantiacus]|uniref:hypothetical protein n=1 Tax=Saccharicrinis aurantiacus TaxID=1849719 RepID=UPI00094FD87A|nr:hypothetical protein [Saccharicrinis aurantiacus]